MPTEQKKQPSKKRGLGRGLDALFEDEEINFSNENNSESSDSSSSSQRKLLAIEQIIPSASSQPRHVFDEHALNELAESIKEHGLLQPILIRPSSKEEGKYEIVAGERRWRASQKAMLHEVPVIIKDLDDTTALQIALIENLQREDLNSIEEAKGYQRLMDEFGHSAEEVGKVLGKSRSHIANTTRLLHLPENVQNMVSDGQLSAGHARAILTAENPEILAYEIINNSLSVREAEKLAAGASGRNIKKRKVKNRKTASGKDADTLSLENEVSSALGMNVSIDMSAASEGKLSIEFKSLDQLDDILHRLSHYPGHKAEG
jgi:ParB family chromosome partitioning protein